MEIHADVLGPSASANFGLHNLVRRFWQSIGIGGQLSAVTRCRMKTSRREFVSGLEKTKLAIESGKLRRDLSTVGYYSSMIWPMVVSFLTAAAAVFAIGISAMTARNQNIFQEQQFAAQQQADHDKALLAALELATDDKGLLARRLAGL